MGLTIKQSFKQIKDDGYSYIGFLKEIYLKGVLAYIQAILMFIFVILLAFIIVYNMDSLPSFFNWSWLSLFNEPSTNIIVKPIVESGVTGIFQPILLLMIFIAAFLLMPVLAYNEEVGFRSYNTNFKDIVKSSLFFAAIHFPMGIPVYALFILFSVGLVFSFIYTKKFNGHKFSNETTKEEVIQANKNATMYTSRIHALYNVIIISILIALIAKF